MSVTGLAGLVTGFTAWRRTAPLLAGIALAILAAPAANAQCGQTVDVPAHRSGLPGGPPLALGDSVLYDAAGPLAANGFHVNAMVCRTMGQGLTYLQAHNSSLPELVVVALGTNGTVTGADISTLLRILGPGRGLALVTPKGGDDPSVADLYRTLGRSHPGRILVLDWERVSAGHPDWLAPDGTHLGGSAGIAAYARLVTSALSALPGATAVPTTPTPVPAPTITQPAPTPAPAPTPTPAPTPAPFSNPPPSLRPPRSRPAAMTAAEKDALSRIYLYVRLFIASAITNELSPFAL